MPYIQYYDVNTDSMLNVPIKAEEILKIALEFDILTLPNPKYAIASIDDTEKIIRYLKIERMFPDLKEHLFEFLSKKYVQRADSRQKAMGLQYTEAETHDLARAIAKFLKQNIVL